MDTARDFTHRLQDLLRREHGALAQFIVALAEFDERRLWASLEYGSLFDFLHRELHLSKGAAFYRKTAVDPVRRFPEVADALREGKLCLMTVAEVARVLTPENVSELLPRFFGLSKQEAKVLVVSLLPVEAPPLRAVVTPLRVSPAAPALALAAPAAPATEEVEHLVQPVELALSSAPVDPPRSAAQVAPEPPASTVEPLSSSLSRLHVTVTKEFLDKLDAARDALSHSHPGADSGEILEAGLDLLLGRAAKRNGLVKKPRAKARSSKDPDYIPAHVRRAVWKRDQGKCQWRLPSGEICGSTYRLQIDHIQPRAAGGPSTVDNCRLACERHNDLAARQFFGDAWMDRFTRNARAGRCDDREERRTRGR